jgi:hypothetical protein
MIFALLLRRRLRKLEHSPIGIGQAEFIGPAFPMMNDLGIAILFNKGCHMLDRPPASDVPVLSLTEDAVE